MCNTGGSMVPVFFSVRHVCEMLEKEKMEI